MRAEVFIIASLAGCGRIGFDPIVDVDQGLVGHWPFDEGTGTRTTDASGFANDGLLTGGIEFAPGRIGMAVSLDGVDGHVNLEESSNVLDVGTRSFSYSVWVYPISAIGMYDCPWWRGGSSSFYPGYDFELGTTPWHASLSDGTNIVLGTFGAEAADTWVLITAVVDREAKRLFVYRDGALVDQKQLAIGSLATTRTAIIGATSNGATPFHGLIDDLRVYGRALDPEEVDALYRVP